MSSEERYDPKPQKANMNSGKWEVSITPDMLDKISHGYCLISQEQAHRLMGLANERAELTAIFDSRDTDRYVREYNRIEMDIRKIWTAVFGGDDALDK